MKTKIILRGIATLLVCCSLFAAAAQPDSGRVHATWYPEVIGQGNTWLGANVMIGRTTINKVFLGMSGFRLGAETNFRSGTSHTWGAKLGYEVSAMFFLYRLSAISYFQQGRAELRLMPELGMSWGGVINLTYGYQLRLSRSTVDELPHHRIGLGFNFNRALMKEVL